MESAGDAVARLDELTRKLRRECPWDREQDERSIVPHTVGEAYELAAAAHSGDDSKMVDELGDVLFQVHFLSLLLEERGQGSLAQVADHVHEKLVRRHPHIFGEVEVDSSGEVLKNWDQIKKGEDGREPGIFGDVPENLPGPLYALKTQRRAASTGFDFDHVPYDGVTGKLEELEAAKTREETFHEVGDVLFAAINVARKLKVDRGGVAGGERPLSGAGGGCGGDRGPRRSRLGRTGYRRATRLLLASTYRAGEMSQIESVHAREILDSRGNPTVEVDVTLASWCRRPRGRALRRVAPASTRRTSCATATTRYLGKGVTQAVGNVNDEIGRARRLRRR